jgi:hypothetical protein
VIMRQAKAQELSGVTPSTSATPSEAGMTLRVAMIYQDALTRDWASELWERVDQLMADGAIHCEAWNVSELAQDSQFACAVNAAARAEVVVIAVRDNGELPLFLHVWIDAWMPRRMVHEGALVAIIGVPGRPDSRVGRAHHYLEAVARRAGLDYLPQERMLPECSLAIPAFPGITATNPWSARGGGYVSARHPYRRVTE